MTTDGVTILPWAVTDRDDVTEFILGIQQGEFGLPITAADQPDLADVDGFYRSTGGEFWVVRNGGAVVGTIALVSFEPGRAAIRKLFVAPSHRGPVGLAATLMAQLLIWAAAHGVQQVWLGTTSLMTIAQRFYTRLGFERVARSDLPDSFPVMAVDSVFFRRAT